MPAAGVPERGFRVLDQHAAAAGKAPWFIPVTKLTVSVTGRI